MLGVAAGRAAVHPRASGEHSSPSLVSTRVAGSSPRERGTPRSSERHVQRRRFIPARAGNTRLSASTPQTQRGSSPRERGTRRDHRVAEQTARFIPARAGNTYKPGYGRRSKPVHPRASGEHRDPACPTPRLVGSSPRERGTHQCQQMRLPRRRFIPARAGNTPETPPECSPTCGSSPRERGTH